jgi:phosphate transport system substrate-binding protein
MLAPPDSHQSRNPSAWLLLILILAFCRPPVAARQTVALVGSGSNVPAPLFEKWADAYNKRSPRTQLRYLPMGTSEGIQGISRGSGDFAAGEVPLTAAQRATGGLTEVPLVLIAIVPVYNLPHVHEELRFSGDLLAEIFLGHVKNWNAPPIA